MQKYLKQDGWRQWREKQSSSLPYRKWEDKTHGEKRAINYDKKRKIPNARQLTKLLRYRWWKRESGQCRMKEYERSVWARWGLYSCKQLCSSLSVGRTEFCHCLRKGGNKREKAINQQLPCNSLASAELELFPRPSRQWWISGTLKCFTAPRHSSHQHHTAAPEQLLIPIHLPLNHLFQAWYQGTILTIAKGQLQVIIGFDKEINKEECKPVIKAR